MLIAGELGTGLRVVSGKMTVNEARIVLVGMNDHDALFIDELHRLVSGGKAGAEWLLHLLSDGVVMGCIGPEAQPKATVIGATTDVGRLPETMCRAFPLRPALVAGLQQRRGGARRDRHGREDPAAVAAVA